MTDEFMLHTDQGSVVFFLYFFCSTSEKKSESIIFCEVQFEKDPKAKLSVDSI